MSENNGNVINFFKHQTNSGKMGYPFVKLIKDTNGNFFSEKYLREYAKKVHYIVTVMRQNETAVTLYKYNVPQVSLIDFLNDLKNNKIEGEIVDIEKYIPEDLA